MKDIDKYVDKKAKEIQLICSMHKEFRGLMGEPAVKSFLHTIIEDLKPKVNREWVEKTISTISLRCRRDRCGDIEFDGEEAEDDLIEGLKEVEVEVEG